MRDLRIYLVRMARGDESTEFHTHHCDEEFIYILSRRGVAEIGTRKIEVAHRDFIRFKANYFPQALYNS